MRSQTNTYFFGMFTSSSHCDVFQPHYDEYNDERRPSMIAISNEKYIGKLGRDVVSKVHDQNIKQITKKVTAVLV